MSFEFFHTYSDTSYDQYMVSQLLIKLNFLPFFLFVPSLQPKITKLLINIYNTKLTKFVYEEKTESKITLFNHEPTIIHI